MGEEELELLSCMVHKLLLEYTTGRRLVGSVGVP